MTRLLCERCRTRQMTRVAAVGGQVANKAMPALLLLLLLLLLVMTALLLLKSMTPLRNA